MAAAKRRKKNKQDENVELGRAEKLVKTREKWSEKSARIFLFARIVFLSEFNGDWKIDGWKTRWPIRWLGLGKNCSFIIDLIEEKIFQNFTD